MSKPLVVSIPHHLGKPEALRRLRDGLGQLKAAYASKMSVFDDTWTGDRLDFRIGALGQSASGTIDVSDDQVVCSIQLPWLLAMVAEKAKSLIQKEGTLMLEKK